MTRALDSMVVPLARDILAQWGTAIQWTKIVPGTASAALSATGEVPKPTSATVTVHGAVEEYGSNRPEDFNLKRVTCAASDFGGAEPRYGDKFLIGGKSHLVMSSKVLMATDDPALYVVLVREETQVTR